MTRQRSKYMLNKYNFLVVLFSYDLLINKYDQFKDISLLYYAVPKDT